MFMSDETKNPNKSQRCLQVLTHYTYSKLFLWRTSFVENNMIGRFFEYQQDRH